MCVASVYMCEEDHLERRWRWGRIRWRDCDWRGEGRMIGWREVRF